MTSCAMQLCCCQNNPHHKTTFSTSSNSSQLNCTLLTLTTTTNCATKLFISVRCRQRKSLDFLIRNRKHQFVHQGKTIMLVSLHTLLLTLNLLSFTRLTVHLFLSTYVSEKSQGHWSKILILTGHSNKITLHVLPIWIFPLFYI